MTERQKKLNNALNDFFRSKSDGAFTKIREEKIKALSEIFEQVKKSGRASLVEVNGKK